tara:strand:- start:491 stop:964 length:474 start_codon:yes stop_codon:yes gene_type:complete
MDIKEAMKIVSEVVFIFSGDERVEEALQTVESELGLKQIKSDHGFDQSGEPFHYVREWRGPSPYNKLYQLAREMVYDKLTTEDSFRDWLQKHTVIDHFEGAIMIRRTQEEEHDDGIEFHDYVKVIYEDGDTAQTDYRYFEELLLQPLSVREGHAETV